MPPRNCHDRPVNICRDRNTDDELRQASEKNNKAHPPTDNRFDPDINQDRRITKATTNVLTEVDYDAKIQEQLLVCIQALHCGMMRASTTFAVEYHVTHSAMIKDNK
jgi:hypothetical protein